MKSSIASHSFRETGHVKEEHLIHSSDFSLFTIRQVQQRARSLLISSQSILFGSAVAEVFEAVKFSLLGPLPLMISQGSVKSTLHRVSTCKDCARLSSWFDMYRCLKSTAEPNYNCVGRKIGAFQSSFFNKASALCVCVTFSDVRCIFCNGHGSCVFQAK